MFFKKNKNEDFQEMCSETASLFTKLRNVPYLKTHRGMFCLYWVLTFLKNIITFALFSMFVGIAFTDISLFLKSFFGG